MEKQKLILEEKLTRDCKDALKLKATEYVHTLLKRCKRGVDHTQMIKKIEADAIFKSILCCEIACRKWTSNGSKSRLHLYKLNQLSAAELK